MNPVRALAAGLCFFLPVVTLSFAIAAAGPALNLGYLEGAGVVPPARDCPGELYVNHDSTFENGYAWDYGVAPPDWGSFAEGYDLGAGIVTCGVYWVTQIGHYHGQPIDCYIWEGGVSRPPGTVVLMLTGVVLDNVPFWPEVGQSNVEMDLAVAAEFSVGYWPAHYQEMAFFYVAADENGPGGHPWAKFMPGMGYPSGWQHPRMLWGNTQSLGLGAYFVETCSPIEASTWGAIKQLFTR